jgi:Holliday junction resolvasome RuvABC endonuclease subunit
MDEKYFSQRCKKHTRNVYIHNRKGIFCFGKRTNILALDLGTQTGWALRQASGVISGSVGFAANKLAGGRSAACGRSAASYGMRFLKFRNWLVGMFQKHQVDLVIFEDVRNHAGVYAAHAYGGFLAHMMAVCEEMHVPYRGFGVKTIKKFITGNGNAGKQDVIKAIEAKGYKPVDDNEADAIALLLLAESELVKESKGMNTINTNDSKCNYKTSIKLRLREEGESIDSYNLSDREILMGPFKYSEVTGKSTAVPR